MSAPHVAGIIALMLQYDPTISALQIPAILRESAREDPFTGFLPAGGSPTWGFGKADARSATGFFRLSIVSLTLPSSVIVRVTVDHDAKILRGNSWFDIYFLKGTVHRISIMNEMLEGANARYMLLGNTNFTVSGNQVDVLKYRTQYYLEVASNYGVTEGSGWYDAGTVIQLDSPASIDLGGFLGLLGAKLVKIGAWGVDQKSIQYEPIILNRPQSFMVLYVLSYPPEVTEAFFAICFSILLICGLRGNITSSRKHPSLEPEHHREDPS
jgi:hypothetical protein